jgi:hypothetical protein
MSDIQELIYRQGVLTFNAGMESERNRILRLLEQSAVEQQKLLELRPNRADNRHREMAVATTYQLIALIKGGTNA